MSLIDDLRPKMEAKQKEREEEKIKKIEKEQEENIKNKKDSYTEEELFYRYIYLVIKKEIKKMVTNSMSYGNLPPDINHYYYETYIYHDYGYSDIEPDVIEYDGLHKSFFSVLDDTPLLNEMVIKLKDYIKDKIGYTYCEVKLEDKILKYDEKYTGVFGGVKNRIASKRGKAIWIHASMNKDGFDKVKSNGYKVRYEGPPMMGMDSNHYENQKYKACIESGRKPREWFHL